ncbi:MAG: polyprenyl synthetase family protein [Cardiobacteriaceae bacterium]|nr:polyprenyl synthetase family protein [Cardiobacteriaceae bacterium]
MTQPMTTQAIRELIHSDLAQTESLMFQEIRTEIPLAELVMQYTLQNGGKRFRPMLTLLASGLCQYQHEHRITAAAFIEFIHSATLLHDDVVDESPMRRGKPAAHVNFGNAASILVGDFLYTRAFQLMVRTQNMALISLMADTVNLVSAGEVMQLSHAHDPNITEERYYRVIEHKTAVLFSAACQIPALLANLSTQHQSALRDYGRLLGMSFQIMDDLLDYTGDPEKIGKALGDDLAEGKPTLPLIRALNVLPEPKRLRLQSIIEQGEREAMSEVLALLAETDALDYSLQTAKRLAQEAIQSLQCFDSNPYQQALISLAIQATERQH